MTKFLTIRLTPEEIAQCDAWAKELGVTRTDFVRSRLFDTPRKPYARKKQATSSKAPKAPVPSVKKSTKPKARAPKRK